MAYSNLTFIVQPNLSFVKDDYVNLYGSDAATTTTSTTTTTTTASPYTLIGTANKVPGNGTCTNIGLTPVIYLDSTDYAKFVGNGGCFNGVSGLVSTIRDSGGTAITGTFVFTYFGVTCSYTTFTSTNGNLTLNNPQC